MEHPPLAELVLPVHSLTMSNTGPKAPSLERTARAHTSDIHAKV